MTLAQSILDMKKQGLQTHQIAKALGCQSAYVRAVKRRSEGYRAPSDGQPRKRRLPLGPVQTRQELRALALRLHALRAGGLL